MRGINSSADTELWCAVIKQAIADATESPYPPDTRSGWPIAQTQVRQDARDWLLDGGEDFDEICHLAGFNPETVRVHARQKILEADKSGTLRWPIIRQAPRPKPVAPGRRRKDSVWLTYDGRTQTLTEWSREIGVSRGAIRHRQKLGLPPDLVFAAGKLPHGPGGIDRLSSMGKGPARVATRKIEPKQDIQP